MVEAERCHDVCLQWKPTMAEAGFMYQFFGVTVTWLRLRLRLRPDYFPLVMVFSAIPFAFGLSYCQQTGGLWHSATARLNKQAYTVHADGPTWLLVEAYYG